VNDRGDRAPHADRAHRYEQLRNRILGLHLLAAVLLPCAYLFTGASSELADSLLRQAGGRWFLAAPLYLTVSLFGYAAAVFPLHYIDDFVLGPQYRERPVALGDWMGGFVQGVLLEILVVGSFFTGVYGLLRWAPAAWWVFATGFYLLFSFVLTAVFPVLFLPAFRHAEPIANRPLRDDLTRRARERGLDLTGVFRWALHEGALGNGVALAGWGRRRKLFVAERLLEDAADEEIAALTEVELAHSRSRDTLRLAAAHTGLALAGFYLTHRAFAAAARAGQRFGVDGIDDLAGFPLLVLCLVLFAVIVMPLVNAYSRRRALRADALAIRRLGSAEALVRAVNRWDEESLVDRNPARWVEILLRSRPSLDRRIRHARDVEASIGTP
jgi:STE24 endopeptidase